MSGRPGFRSHPKAGENARVLAERSAPSPERLGEPDAIKAIRARVSHDYDDRQKPLDTSPPERRWMWQAREDIDTLLRIADKAEMYRQMYQQVASEWAVVLQRLDLAEDATASDVLDQIPGESMFDGSVCPACHHRAHDPGSCPECPRCELHVDEAAAFVLRSLDAERASRPSVGEAALREALKRAIAAGEAIRDESQDPADPTFWGDRVQYETAENVLAPFRAALATPVPADDREAANAFTPVDVCRHRTIKGDDANRLWRCTSCGTAFAPTGVRP